MQHCDDPSLISFSSKSSTRTDGRHKLKLKIEKLNEENSKLRENLQAKETEQQQLNNKIASLSNSISSLTAEYSLVSAAKVVESKKNRKLTAEIQSTKSKGRNLQEIHKNLEKLLQQKDEQLRQFVESQSVADPSPTEIQILMEKLEKANQKIFEALNQNTKLKNELKVAQKCLQQEIGENFTIAQIMSGHSNWRGRAQQIAMLQSKIAIMKDKLETTSLESDGGSRLSLKRSESMRRLEAESLTKDLEECKMQIEEFRQKVLALKTRNKNLSDEANNYKLKTLELLEKSEHDEEFIKCLNEQISVVKFECKHKLDEMKLDVKQVEKMRQDAEFEAEKLSCELQNHDASLQEKIAEISNLRSIINQLESNLRDISGDFLFSCRDMSKEKYLTLLKNLENEKRELLSFLKDLNERLSSESIKTSNQHDVISKQRLKIVRLESKLKEMENEKEASKTKNRRVIRINEYSRTLSGSNIHCQHRPITRSNQMTVEIDKIKFNKIISRLELATDRIAFLDMKLKELNDERDEDNQRFAQIMTRSKEIYKELYGDKESNLSSASECRENNSTTAQSASHVEK